MPIFYKECIDAWYGVTVEKKPKVKTVVDMIQQAENQMRNDGLELKLGEHWRKVATMKRAELLALLAGSMTKSKNEKKWDEKFENIDWNAVYQTLTITSIPRKVRIFQWKLLNSAVFTEQRLKECGLSNGMCLFCGGEEETSLHLVADCDSVREFWMCVITLIRKSVPKFEYNDEIVLLGCTKANCGSFSKTEIEIVNFLILMAKWIIWKRRCVYKYDGGDITQEMMWNWYDNYIRGVLQMSKYIKSKKCRVLFDSIKLN